MGGIPQGGALGSLLYIKLFLIYVNDMLLQIQNESLLQFADDTCLICYGGDHTQVKDFLSGDLVSLARWIASCNVISQPKNTHISLNTKPSWLT